MKMHLFDLISAKLEIWRLEQRYTKRRNRRSTFVSEAVYVDGEYIYATPSPTSLPPPTTTTTTANRRAAASKRHSAAVDFGSVSSAGPSSESVAESDGTGKDESWKSRRLGRKWNPHVSEKRRSMVTVQEARWNDSRP